MASLDNRFYEELHIPRTLWQSTAEFTWDIWIQHYFDLRKGLSVRQRSELHTEIDRFWFMVEEGRYKPRKVFDLEKGKEDARLLAMHRIESPIGRRADMWLKIAGAYVEGKRRENVELGRKAGESEDIETTIPAGWLIHPENGNRSDAFNYWLDTVSEDGNWRRFVHSYRNDTHGVTIKNKAICASLRSFINRRYMDKFWKGREVKNFGKPLIKPAGQLYWPKVLDVYNTSGGAWYLYRAVEAEYMSVQVCQATADGDDPQNVMPVWLKMGYNPLKQPPTQ